jgi:hypothetical protein
VVGGLILAWYGLGFAVYLGGYLGLLPGLFGVIGVLWVALGVLALARRNYLAIVINEAGIEIPTFRLYQRRKHTSFGIPHDDRHIALGDLRNKRPQQFAGPIHPWQHNPSHTGKNNIIITMVELDQRPNADEHLDSSGAMPFLIFQEATSGDRNLKNGHPQNRHSTVDA